MTARSILRMPIWRSSRMAGSATPVILDDGQIDVDDVALFQNLVGRGDAVTNHLIDGGENGLRIPLIPHVGWNGALDIHDVVVADSVERLRAHPRNHVGLNHAENLCSKPACLPRHLDVL